MSLGGTGGAQDNPRLSILGTPTPSLGRARRPCYGLGPFFQTCKEFRHRDAERSRKHREDLNTQVAGAVLGGADVGAVDSGSVREFLLGPVFRQSQFFDPLPDGSLQRWIGLFSFLLLHSYPASVMMAVVRYRQVLDILIKEKNAWADSRYWTPAQEELL